MTKKYIFVPKLNKVRGKLKSSKGETLVETLIAMLIIVLPFVTLAAAVMTSSEVNHQIKIENSTTLDYENPNTYPETITFKSDAWTSTYSASGLEVETLYQVLSKEEDDDADEYKLKGDEDYTPTSYFYFEKY